MLAMKALPAVFVLLSAGPAAAHVTPDAFAPGATWTYDFWLTIPLYAVGIAFLVGTRRIWRAAGAGRGIRTPQLAAFWSGWSVLALALVSPLHWLGERLFTAHMIEHELLMLIAAPLLAFARPGGALLWSLPGNWRPAAGALLNSRSVAAGWRFLSHPVTATALYGLALWVWHVPALYTWALDDPAAHRFEHLSFFFAALLFWWVLFHGRGIGRGARVRDGIAVGCLFVTVLHSGLLGALLTLSGRIWFPQQVAFAADFGLTPLQDQELAGLVMWIPMGLAYSAAALFFAYRWLFPRGRIPAFEPGRPQAIL
jgi:cytochrome c oxidase assembly factor CtaG